MFDFPRRADHLGLQAALSDRVLPILVAAMSFLAALALAGTLASATLAAQWRGDTAAALTLQIPNPGNAAANHAGTRLTTVLRTLQTAPGIANPHLLSAAEVDRLLTPWLGAGASQLALPVPAIITATWQGPGTPDSLATTLAAIAPGTQLATGAAWASRVAALTTSLQACAAAVLVIVALVAAAVISIATRSGLAQRRETIEIIHSLGALDADIADRFAGRATVLTLAGASAGALLALPILVWLAALAAPFAGPAAGLSPVSGLPPALWIALPSLPLIAAGIGWLTAQLTVHGWLRNLA
jgi:cell division transport system permease protein